MNPNGHSKMKVPVTLTVDSELKIAAMPIIQNKMQSTLSHELNELLKKIIQENKEEK